MSTEPRVDSDGEQLDGKRPLTGHEVIQLHTLTGEELVIEKRLKRRLDLLIMPLVILIFLMNYIDRNNYASARLQGLEHDLNLKGSQYQTALSIFYVSYILAQIPANLILNYVGRPSLHLGFFVTAWGLVSALTSQVSSYGSMVACRFILGMVEAPFVPGVLFYLSKWYTRRELNLRMAIFYSGSLISGAFGNLIAAGILSGLAGARGLSSWQWLYLLEGVITMAVGIIVCFVLPDFPQSWRLLSDDEKAVAHRRLALDAAEADSDEAGSMSQLKGLQLALSDFKTYILAGAHVCMIGAISFQNFFPTLIGTLGYSHVVTLLLAAPPYVFITVYSYGHGYLADRLNMRFWFYIYPIPITIVGFILFMTVDSFGPKYFSFFLVVFAFAMYGTLYSWIASSIPRPPAKRAAAIALINAAGNSSSIWTSYLYDANEAPYYRTAFGTCIGLQIGAAACGFALRWALTRENRRLERLDNVDVELSERDLVRLRLTAEQEGIDLDTARALQKNYRYLV
ncbi:hypothetical protein A1O3_05929 [Capronia epimyces CBS 606.96]|uniref:Major facilitator superfamily (MFS) profile domain-containing protein n=1 Tax=Capronia epimyces CBS 606.96 TaxID=1182542 RepID=W9YSI9_9EURO|nr:uncharacterized protein A1O3_05929 [Capronia epimyces CBS 606.96]EXJ85254.1 hypothetical protein A1O3_05929 [Capronia epimyces CBS 606.96]